jgi:hypothetical protein
VKISCLDGQRAGVAPSYARVARDGCKPLNLLEFGHLCRHGWVPVYGLVFAFP